MYKFYRDYLRSCWNIYFTENGKEDFITSVATIEEAYEICNQKNYKLINAEPEDE